MSASTTAKSFDLDLLAMAPFRRLSIPQYHQMIANGILPEGEPIELIEGYLVEKMSRGTPHDETMDFLDRIFVALITSGWYVRNQRAITLSDSEPEPDYAIVRGAPVRNRGHHPLATEVGLVIEVSDSSLALDRTHKARIYARAGIPVYWVVNVIDKQIEVYTQPSGPCETPTYAKQEVFAVGTSVPVVLDGNSVGTIAVSDVVG